MSHYIAMQLRVDTDSPFVYFYDSKLGERQMERDAIPTYLRFSSELLMR
jgi:hypothetical protein